MCLNSCSTKICFFFIYYDIQYTFTRAAGRVADILPSRSIFQKLLLKNSHHNHKWTSNGYVAKLVFHITLHMSCISNNNESLGSALTLNKDKSYRIASFMPLDRRILYGQKESMVYLSYFKTASKPVKTTKIRSHLQEAFKDRAWSL